MINNMMNRIAAAGALLLLNGAAAFAQSELKFEAPFTFHTVGATMAPGKYTVVKVETTSHAFYRVRHESGKTALVVPASVIPANAPKASAAVTFLCAGEYCALKAIDPGYGRSGAELPVRMRPGFRGEKVAEVRIPAVR